MLGANAAKRGPNKGNRGQTDKQEKHKDLGKGVKRSKVRMNYARATSPNIMLQ
jgi:hypothetical protein